MQIKHRNYTIAAILTAIVAAWLIVGMVLGGEETAARERASEPSEKPASLFAVAVETSQAQAIQRKVRAQGATEPDRVVTVRAQTSGELAEMLTDVGQQVAAGDVIARLQPDDRPVRLREARALLSQRQTEFEAAEKLNSRGYQSRVQRETAQAEMEAARASVQRIELEMGHTRIKAPFDGTVEARDVAQGDYVSVGGDIATVVDNDPLRAVIFVSQQSVQHISTGQMADITLMASGEKRQAEVFAVAPRADEQTRTYRVELRVPNAARTPAGGSISVAIPVERIMAHRISPALLSLDAEGRLGVKVVNDQDEVVYHLIDIVRSGANGIWVTGLPEQARIITRGGGFVTAGEQVNPQAPDQLTPAQRAVAPAQQGAPGSS